MLASAFALASAAPSALAEQKKVLLVAGVQSHGPGDHEFNAGFKLIRDCLADNALVDAQFVAGGWPEASDALKTADAIIFYADGGGRHPAMSGDRAEKLDAFAARGGGIGLMHYGVEVPKGPPQEHAWKWVGGAYEHMYSVNPMWKPVFDDFPNHPITRGVKPFALLDEWYFNMRWGADQDNVTRLLVDTPSEDVRDGPYVWPNGPYPHIVESKGEPETMMWAYERPEGGRGFGFTGGHKHVNWYEPNYRKIVLNAILWVAGAEPPEGGVESTVSLEQIQANLDPKRGLEAIPNFSGDWEFEVTFDGQQTGAPRFHIAQAANNIIGTYNGAFGEQAITGSVSREGLTITFDAEYEGLEFSNVYKGSFSSDGKLSGSLSLGDGQYEGTWIGKRR